MSHKKPKITLPAELRRKVRPWDETRRKEILNTVKKVKRYPYCVVIAGALLGIGITTVYRELHKRD